jgi:hypothetical protein
MTIGRLDCCEVARGRPRGQKVTPAAYVFLFHVVKRSTEKFTSV